jgi:hypothetical protein
VGWQSNGVVESRVGAVAASRRKLPKPSKSFSVVGGDRHDDLPVAVLVAVQGMEWR